MNRIQAIKVFFEKHSVRGPITMQELKALSPQDREELSRLAAAELGVELVPYTMAA